jgi:hypothetical protein
MPYDPNSPAAAQLLSVSQPIIQGNFAILQNIFDINHVDYNSGTNAGKHIYVELPIAAGNPIPPIAFPAAEIVVYAATNATTTVNELYVNKTNQATVVQVPMTASILSTSSNPGLNVSGWTYLPSGILLKWGSGSANGNTPILFPVAANIPVFTNVMSMQLCTAYANTADANLFARLGNFSNTGFNAYGSQRTSVTNAAVGFQYLAIGY